jgi:hypothetical protein
LLLLPAFEAVGRSNVKTEAFEEFLLELEAEEEEAAIPICGLALAMWSAFFDRLI